MMINFSISFTVCTFRLQILVGTNFSVFVRQHLVGTIHFSDFCISFGVSGIIIISGFRSTLVMLY